ncbi:MAG: RodZ domain-containing protein [Cyanobacteriota bacterium]|nr:RodZ domain-containing protein [Cyanobacteriota bacterium]
MIDSVAPPPSSEGADQPIPELRRLGEQLAQAREQAGMAVEDLASRLRVAPGQLKALEEGNHTRLPEGVFVLALARRVAGVLRVNLDEPILAVRQSRLMGGGHLASPPPTPRPEGSTPSPPTGQPPPQGAEPADPTPSPAPSALPALAPEQAPEQAPERAQAPARLPWRWPLAALVASAGLAAVWLWSSSSPPRVASPPAVSAPPQAPPPAVMVAPDALRLLASEPSWVEVRQVDGRTLYEGTLTGEKQFPIGRGLEVMAGRPHAVRAAVGTGPATPLGGVSDIRWKRFSPAAPPPGGPASTSSSR